MTRIKFRHFSFKFFLIFLIISFCALIFWYLTPPVVNWDEGTHALWGYKEWLALRDFNIPLFLKIASEQFSYPPLGSWIIAFLALPFDFNIYIARFASTIGLMLCAFLIFLINQSWGKKRLSGVISTVMLLSSPAMLFYGVTVFKEVWGAALSLLFIYYYFESSIKKSWLNPFLAGLSLVILFFEKYNYAVLILVPLVLESCWEFVVFFLGKSKKKKELRFILIKNILTFTPFLIAFCWWIFTPDSKLEIFINILKSDWANVTLSVGTRADHLLYYFNSLRVSYFFSEAFFYLAMLGFFVSLRLIYQRRVRFLAFFFLLNMVLGILHDINLQDRYILTSVPAFFIISGWGLENLTQYFWKGSKRIKTIAILFIVPFVIFMIFDFVIFPQRLKQNASHMLLSAMYNEKDYKDTLFDFSKAHWAKQNSNGGLWGLRDLKRETPDDVINYIFENIDLKKPFEIMGYTSEISPDWVELSKQLYLVRCVKREVKCINGDNFEKYVITIKVNDNSRLNTFDYKRANSWVLPKIEEFSKTYSLNRLISRNFEDLQVEVSIYAW